MKHLCIYAIVLSALLGCDASTTGKQEAPSLTPTTQTSESLLHEGYYSFNGLTEEKIQYQEKGGINLFQGDIVLHGINSKKTTAGLVANGVNLWNNNGTVAYDMRSMPISLRENWLTAIQHIARRTNIRFSRDKNLYQHTTSSGTVYDYINVIENTEFAGGYSSVGRVGNGPQALGLSVGVNSGLIAHELLHALGHWHEQSREDRDQFVQVNLQNIPVENQHNFAIHSSDALMQGGYDYCSIMHYFSTAFSSNGLPTIEPTRQFSCMVTGVDNINRTFTTIGQRSGLSAGDIGAITNRYSTVPAARPFAFAGFDQVIRASSSTATSVPVTLDASRSFPVSGTGLTYTWMAFYEPGCTAPVTGCTLALQSLNSSSPRLTTTLWLPLIKPGTNVPRRSAQNYVLIVRDGAGRTASDVVKVSAFSTSY